MRARKARARACGMSSCASSAAHESRKAAPKIETPEDNASQCGAGCMPEKCRISHCSGRMKAPASQSQFFTSLSPVGKKCRGGSRPAPTAYVELPGDTDRYYSPNSLSIPGLLVQPLATLTNSSKKTL